MGKKIEPRMDTDGHGFWGKAGAEFSVKIGVNRGLRLIQGVQLVDEGQDAGGAEGERC